MLRTEVFTLRQLVGALEQLVADQATRLERAVAESEERAARLARSEVALRAAIDELSTPVLEVALDTLALPLIGVIDSRRAAQIMERLLGAVAEKRARVVIIDVTGVAAIDTSTADHFMKLIRAVRLLGARCILSGVQPAVAATLVAQGVHIGGVHTSQTLRDAIQQRDTLLQAT